MLVDLQRFETCKVKPKVADLLTFGFEHAYYTQFVMSMSYSFNESFKLCVFENEISGVFSVYLIWELVPIHAHAFTCVFLCSCVQKREEKLDINA